MLKRNQKQPQPLTPIEYAVSVIGNKWKLLILHTLMSRALPWHIPELVQAVRGIDQTVLKVTLQSMEKDGLIVSVVHKDLPPRVEFSLSEQGESLRPLLHALEEWGKAHGH